MRTPFTAYFASRTRGADAPLEADPLGSSRAANAARSDAGRHEYSGTDHRQSDRFRAWGTLVLFSSEAAPLAGDQVGVVEDASPAGLYIAIHQPPPVGTLLRMRIYCQAGPQGTSVVEASGSVTRCHLHEPRGAGVQILDFADEERGRQAWLELVRQPFPNVALMPPPVRPPLHLAPAASRRTAATGPAAGLARVLDSDEPLIECVLELLGQALGE